MYDPLIEPYPKPNQGYPSSYWSEGILPPVTPEIKQDMATDVAIIGAGFTGLSTAIHLAQNYQIKASVIDANDIGWGSSGRNAGFVLAGTGRISVLDAQKKWGNETGQLIYREYQNAIETVNRLIEQGNINCDKTPGGYLKVAHKKELVNSLFNQAKAMQDNFSDPIEFVDSQRVSSEFLSAKDAYGGIYQAQCYGVNPLKLVLGYHQLAIGNGADVFSNSPVTDWRKEGDQHILVTSGGVIRAKKVVIATNGWTAKNLHQSVASRHLPVLSSIIVTRKLTANEMEQIGLKPGLMVMDTRTLKYYYRLLPDGRILFGGRGAVAGKDESQPQYRQRLINALKQTLPQLHDISVDYFWSGWVSVAYDDYPRICQTEDESVFYSMGYCGSGLSFAAQAGMRLAQKIAGDSNLPALPYLQGPLPKFPFSPFRRLGLKGFYLLSKFMDG